jgi:acetylornithine deacetylase/succinyl-diaminopimelate desuccinylase-like protein
MKRRFVGLVVSCVLMAAGTAAQTKPISWTAPSAEQVNAIYPEVEAFYLEYDGVVRFGGHHHLRRGGHGAQPQNTVDPIVIAARTVLALQTIVSRENNPLDPAVITVGTIHDGTKNNIIPDEVKLELAVRSYKPDVRKHLLAAIERVAKGEALAGGAPREPLVKVAPAANATYNDPEFNTRPDRF